jgi:hypothetical protein
MEHVMRFQTRTTSTRIVEALESRRLLSFSPTGSYTVGNSPIGMQSGDFNGDGIADLATANTGRSVSVLLGNGNGTFQPARNTTTSYYISLQNALAVGDFDRDGKLDLATSALDPAGVGVNVLLGRGDGTFANASAPGGGWWSSSIATGDMNGDGKLDLVATAADPFNGTTYVDVLPGNGDGTFSNTFDWGDGPAESYSLALADLDRDNNLDLVLGGNFTTAVLLGAGDGTVRDYRDLGLVAESLTVADFNADGKPDLATTAGNSVSVLLGNGDGSFQTARSFTTTGGSVAAADVNGDGALDLVLGRGSVLLGTGDGNFGPPITTPVNGSYLVAADFNRDGRLDAAVTNSNTVSVLLNDGNWGTKTYVGPTGGNWSTASNWSPNGAPSAGDFASITGKSVNLSSSATVASLTLSGGASLMVSQNGSRVLRTSALAIGLGSKLDLKDNDLVVDYTGASPIGSWNGSAYTGVTGLIQSGRNGGAWNGSGIVSLSASKNFTTLGVAELNGDVVVKFTYGGDANLDGKINIDDYVRIDSGIASHLMGWSDGDFNYDGKINVDDYVIIDSNIGMQEPSLGSAPASAGTWVVRPILMREQDVFAQRSTAIADLRI